MRKHDALGLSCGAAAHQDRRGRVRSEQGEVVRKGRALRPLDKARQGADVSVDANHALQRRYRRARGGCGLGQTAMHEEPVNTQCRQRVMRGTGTVAVAHWNPEATRPQRTILCREHQCMVGAINGHFRTGPQACMDQRRGDLVHQLGHFGVGPASIAIHDHGPVWIALHAFEEEVDQLHCLAPWLGHPAAG